MNNVVLSGIVACLLIAGLIFSPVIIRQFYVAQAATRPGSITDFGVCRPGSITKSVTLYAQGKTLDVAPNNTLTPGGVKYDADVFGTNATNGTIPGPLISLTQGENLNVTLVNNDTEIHSLDFHMGYGTDQANSGPVPPNKSNGGPVPPNGHHSWKICNPAPGLWFYHCSANMLNGIWKHIANGMFGGVVVHPLSEVAYQKSAREFYIVFSELFTNRVGGGYGPDQTPYTFDFDKFYNDQPDLILTNGKAFKYVPHIGDGGTNNECKFPGQEDCTLTLNKSAQVFKVLPGELTRWYIFNAGPNDGVAFHFIGTYQDDYHGFDPAPTPPLHWDQQLHRWVFYPGHLIRQDMNDQVNWIPPASGQIIQAKFPLINTTSSHNPTSQSLNPRSQDNRISLYVGVDHNMNHVIKGGAFGVVAVCPPGKGPVCGPLSVADEPFGTWVPPIHSKCVLSTQNGLCPLAAVANATK